MAKSMTATEVYAHMADVMEMPKSEVKLFFEELADLMHQQCRLKGAASKRGPGVFVLPSAGLKVENKMVPKRKARMGRNPATGEDIKIPAKPAHLKAKARLLKKFHVGCGNVKDD